MYVFMYGLAYVAIFRYKSKLGNIKIAQILDCIGMRKGLSMYKRAKLIMETIKA